MRAVQLLMEEHELILRALRVLEVLAARALRNEPLPEKQVTALLEFLTEFADTHHHHKEEEILFPALEEAGFPHDAGPVGVMLHEHDEGRKLISALRESAQNPSVFAHAARAYAALLAAHIDKENHVLFRMAQQAIQGQERERVEQAFDEFERTSGARRTRYEGEIARLSKELT